MSPTPKKFPVVEVFGPTIQGEGILQGRPCYFVRMGGCDYKCDWCDSPHAVLPELVRHAERLTAVEIMDRLTALHRGPNLVVLSGGNPALHDLHPLIFYLHRSKFKVSAETQGTVWKNWLRDISSIAVSPKGPSSGHVTDLKELRRFLAKCPGFSTFLKIVVLDYQDFMFAKEVHKHHPQFKMFLSACNDAGATVGNPSRKDERSDEQIALDLISRGRWLANQVMLEPDMKDVQVQMQNHVLYWGNRIGV